MTNTYREQERYEAANRVVALSALATEAVKGKSKSEAEAILNRLLPEQQPFVKEGVLRTTWISLLLSSDGRVIGVELDNGTRELAKHIPHRVEQSGARKP